MKQQNAFARRVCVMAGVIGLFCAAGAVGVVTLDGTIDFGAGEEWANPRGNAVQTNYTGYGDQRLTPGGFPGSELNELFLKVDANFLYLGITGNLEQNGNALTIFIETGSNGQNVLKTEIAPDAGNTNGPPNAVQSMGQALQLNDSGSPENPDDDFTERDPVNTARTQLDAGFAPNHAFAIDTAGGTLHVTQYALGNPNAPLGQWNDPVTTPTEALDYFAMRVYRGSNPVNGGNAVLSGGSNPNGAQFAFNNTGKQGVTGVLPAPNTTPPPPPAGSTGPPPQPGDPRSHTTGLEAKIPLADLGLTVPRTTDLTVKVMAVISSAAGFFSNQTLPGIGAGANSADLGFRPNFVEITGGTAVNANGTVIVAGDQYATVTRTTAQFGAPGGALDGTDIVNNFSLTNLVASQNSITSFGDRNCLNASGGSELDELYMRTDGSFLYVAVSGNLETNGNAQVLFLDIHAGGQNALKTEIAPNAAQTSCPDNGPPGAVQGMGQALATNQSTGATERSGDTTTTTLDTGFEPETAVAVDTAGGDVHVTQYSMFAASQGTWDDPGTGTCAAPPDPSTAPIEALEYFTTRIYRGSVGLNSGSGTLTGGTNPNDSLYAYNNTGVAGVNGTGDAALGDPRTQITGLEARISLLDLGFTPGQLPLAGPLNVKAMVVLVAPDGQVSNQTLPGIAGFVPNPLCDAGNPLSLCRRPNFNNVSGSQFVSASLAVEGAFSAVINGHNIVSEFNPLNGPALASQDTKTSFGNVQLVTATDCDQQLANGSELDQIFAREQTTPDTNAPGLVIGITGNLETNDNSGSRNNLIVFIDSKAGGETLMDNNNNQGRMTGMAGNTLPMAADYAILINNSNSTMFIDLINLSANISTFIGSDPVTGGDGFLTNGASDVTDWRGIVSNGNLLGVKGADGGVPRDPQPEPANALTAVTGFEILIPRSAIGSPADGQTVCLFAMICNSNGSHISNQFLPALAAGGLPNYGATKTDFAAAGYQCLQVTLGAGCNDPRFDVDGDLDVDLYDFGAFQRCYTGGVGQSPPSPLYPTVDPLTGYPCECFDWGGLARNNRIDGEDFGAFQMCGSGSNVPAGASCDDPPEQ